MLKQTKRRAERKYQKHSSPTSHSDMIHVRKLYRSCINSTRNQYHSDSLSEIKHDLKALHRYINHLLDEDGYSALPSTPSDYTALANEFADFFEKKICDIRSAMPTAEDVYTQDLNSCLSKFSDFKHVSHEEMTEILSNVNDKTCALDPLPPKFIKQHKAIFIPIQFFIAF